MVKALEVMESRMHPLLGVHLFVTVGLDPTASHTESLDDDLSGMRFLMAPLEGQTVEISPSM